jgi:5-methylcytosine-specific restriction endonuclease McrA
MPRLYGRRWGKKRAAQLEQYPFCRLCEATGRMTIATVADHVIPHRDDPELFWGGDLQSLCSTCHDAVKQTQEKTGALRGAALDGRPLDPDHHWNKETNHAAVR